MAENSKKVILVDDDALFTKTMKEYLKVFGGYEVEAFCNPKEALEYTQKNDDCFAIVSDYEMPGMGGDELLEKVMEVCPTIKAIFFSGREIPEMENAARERKLDFTRLKCIQKGLDVNEVIEALKFFE